MANNRIFTRHLTQFLENEAYEPMLAWGLRMCACISIPLFYGLITGHLAAAVWIIITAESICWVELKGSFAQRARALIGGSFLAFLFGLAGSISSNNLLLSLILMMVVVFIACLFKNLGERGSSLSLCVYVMFIVTNAYATKGDDEIIMRSAYILIGGMWATVVGVVASAFISEQTPYRRTIAFIWKSIATLSREIDKGWDGKELRAGLRDIYLKEKEVRIAIDHSLELFGRRAHQKHDNQHAHLMAQLRKSASLVGTNIMAIAGELENIHTPALDNAQRLTMHTILKSLEVISDRMTVYTVTAKPEEEVIIRSRIIRLQNMSAFLLENRVGTNAEYTRIVSRIVQLVERIIKLVENSIEHISSVSEDKKVYRSYSLIKTLLILHPRHWYNSIKSLTNFNTLFFRYALRTTVVATFALFIYKWFHIPYGYWLPFTVLVIIQPYFGATIKKAMDRVLGTVLGGIAGGLLLLLPATFHLKEILLLVSPVLMIYFLKRKYSLATFFITIFLVALFAIEEELNFEVIAIRALCTIGGAGLGVLAEFALLPNWDKNWLPRHLGDALKANYNYLVFTFFPTAGKTNTWTHYKRLAESANSNAFDSFNRYLQEPSGGSKDYTAYYQVIMHSIRITRELNNINMEQEAGDLIRPANASPQKVVLDCLLLFNKIIATMQEAGLKPEKPVEIITMGHDTYQALSTHQLMYADKIMLELKALERDLGK